MVEHTMTKETLKNRLTALCGKEISACSEKELYTGLLSLVQEMAKDKESNQGKKKLYYISAEFLIGKLLSNNMINLGIYDTVKWKILKCSRRNRTRAISWKRRSGTSGCLLLRLHCYSGLKR